MKNCAVGLRWTSARENLRPDIFPPQLPDAVRSRRLPDVFAAFRVAGGGVQFCTWFQKFGNDKLKTLSNRLATRRSRHGIVRMSKHAFRRFSPSVPYSSSKRSTDTAGRKFLVKTHALAHLYNPAKKMVIQRFAIRGAGRAGFVWGKSGGCGRWKRSVTHDFAAIIHWAGRPGEKQRNNNMKCGKKKIVSRYCGALPFLILRPDRPDIDHGRLFLNEIEVVGSIQCCTKNELDVLDPFTGVFPNFSRILDFRSHGKCSKYCLQSRMMLNAKIFGSFRLILRIRKNRNRNGKNPLFLCFSYAEDSSFM